MSNNEIFRRVIRLKTNDQGQVEMFDNDTGDQVSGVNHVVVNIPAQDIATASVEYVMKPGATVPVQEETEASLDVLAYEKSYQDLSERASVVVAQNDMTGKIRDDFSSLSHTCIQIEADGYTVKLTPKEALDLCTWIIQHTQALGTLAVQAGDILLPAEQKLDTSPAQTLQGKTKSRRVRKS